MVAVHLFRDEYDVRIDRTTRWGNPFVIGRDGDRAEVIARYEDWLDDQVAAGSVTLEDLAALDGRRLGCWCAPQRCHGDVLTAMARAAAEALELDDSS